ncbi:MAG: hypothetical protein ABFC30_00390 [Proteiniphilum sp.]
MANQSGLPFSTPANQSDLEHMTTRQIFYKAAAQRVDELQKTLFFEKEKMGQ